MNVCESAHMCVFMFTGVCVYVYLYAWFMCLNVFVSLYACQLVFFSHSLSLPPFLPLSLCVCVYVCYAFTCTCVVSLSARTYFVSLFYAFCRLQSFLHIVVNIPSLSPLFLVCASQDSQGLYTSVPPAYAPPTHTIIYAPLPLSRPISN